MKLSRLERVLKLRVKILLGVLAVFVGLTVWQGGNVYRVLEAVYKDWPIADYEEDDTIDKIPSFEEVKLDQESAQGDPEAADMLRLILSDRNLDHAAYMVEKYPENPFFRFHFAHALMDDTEYAIDPKAGELVSLSLLNSDSNNTHYRYLYAAAKMSNPDVSTSEILDIIEEANQSSEQELPHNRYSTRLDRVYGKRNWQSYIILYSYYVKLNKVSYHIIENSLRSDTPLKRRETYQILSHFADQMIQGRQNLNQMHFGCTLGNLVLWKQGKEVDLTEEEKQTRYCKAGYYSAIRKKAFDVETDWIYCDINIGLSSEIMAILLLLGGVAGGLWLLVFLVHLLRGWATNGRIPLGHYLFLPGLLVGYFALLLYMNWGGEGRQIFWNAERRDDLYLYMIVLSVGLMVLAHLLPSLKSSIGPRWSFRHWRAPFILCLGVWVSYMMFIVYDFRTIRENDQIWLMILVVFLVTLFLAIVFVVLTLSWQLLKLLFPLTRIVRHRIFLLLCITIAVAGAHQAWRVFAQDRYRLHVSWKIEAGYDVCVFPFILLLLSSIVLTYPNQGNKSPLRGLLALPGKSESAALMRKRILWILIPFLFLVWAGILFTSQERLQQKTRLDHIISNPGQYFIPLPTATIETYEAQKERLSLHFLRPEDLEAYCEQHPLDDEYFQDKYREEIPDCPADQYEIFLRYLRDPNSNRNLIVRAKRGDTAGKARLTEWFDEVLGYAERGQGDEYPGYGSAAGELEYLMVGMTDNMSRHCRFSQMMSDLFDLGYSLSGISSENESAARLKAILDTVDWDKVREGNLSYSESVYKYLEKLDKEQANALLGYFLKIIEYYDLWHPFRVDALMSSLKKFGDRELVEIVLKVITEKPLLYDTNKTDYIGDYTKPNDIIVSIYESIAHHFNSNSIEFLKKYLESDHDNVRAFAVSQLNRLDYAWTENELERLGNDASCVVRLNLLFCMNEDIIRKGLADENAVVRVVAGMVKE